MATRNGIIPGSVRLAQAHPLTTSLPAMRKQPDAGLGPVTVRPTSTHSGVGPRRTWYIYFFHMYDSSVGVTFAYPTLSWVVIGRSCFVTQEFGQKVSLFSFMFFSHAGWVKIDRVFPRCRSAGNTAVISVQRHQPSTRSQLLLLL